MALLIPVDTAVARDEASNLSRDSIDGYTVVRVVHNLTWVNAFFQ
jgi:hypothetical protein